MNKFMIAALAGASVFAVAPAQAVVLVAGGAAVSPTAGVPAGQGTLAGSNTFTGSALTFSATIRYAVYLNTANTYDFYFQVTHTGAGSIGANQPIRMLTVSNYAGFSTDAYASGPDPDGAGIFIPANNPSPAIGSTTGVSLSANGQVVAFDFEAFPQGGAGGPVNNLVQGETSATYIVRTNATSFNQLGTFGLIDGSTLSGITFQPTIAAVPEPATWGMLLVGFGLVGAATRRSRRIASVAA